MSEEQPPRTGAQKWRERLYAFIAISLLLTFAACSGLITALELPLRLALGWTWHLAQAVPVLLPDWPKLLLPLACVVTAAWLGHRFVRWWLAVKGSKIDWRYRHTLSATMLVLLGAAAAIALSGVVHQAVWLADAPWWVNRGRFMERTEAMSKIRQLHLAIAEFQGEHGRHPESLVELETNPKLLSQAPEPGAPPEPILYLKPFEVLPDDPGDDGMVILVSPPLGSDRESIVVGFTSGATRSFHRQQLPEILETRRMPAARTHE